MLTISSPGTSSPSRRQQLLNALLQQSGVKGTADRIPRRSDDGPAPLSSGQQRLWLIDCVAPGDPAYTVPVCFRVAGRFDVAAFESALNDVVTRHEILRTTFLTRNDGVVQTPRARLPVAVRFVETADLDGGAPQVERLLMEDARRAFDLQGGPLIRASVYRLTPTDHFVLIAMHHIVCDGWSMTVLFRELTALYQARLRGVELYLPELPIQYADYACWQRDRLVSGHVAAHVDSWREWLRGAPTTIELPADRSRPQRPGFRGGLVRRALGAARAAAIRRLAQSERTTEFVVLLAAYASLLQRYSGQSDLVIGCPVANRARAELAPLIGFLPNTLPLRVDLSGSPSFLDLVRRVRQRAIAAFAAAEAPFEAIVDAVAPARGAHNPLFQVAFVLQDAPPSRVSLGEVEISPVELDLGTAKCDLTVTAAVAADDLNVSFEYSADLFDRDTIGRLSGHFETLLDGMIARPAARVSELPVLSAAEREQILVEWNRSQAPFPDACTAHELFERQVARNPSAPAVAFRGQDLTYGELNARANRIAHALRQQGVGPDVLVAIALRRGPDMIAAMLGVLKAGGAYVPLDLNHPAERVAFLLEDSQSRFLVTTASDRHMLPSSASGLRWIDVEGSEISRQRGGDPEPLAGPSSLAYVIYTSGSTGRPKGVLIEHRSLCNLADAQQKLFKIGPGSRVLQFAACTFDASVWEVFMALASGGCLCLGDGAPFGPDELTRVLQRDRITTVTLPPSLLRTLAPERFPDLHTAISAGEPCSDALVRQWAGRVAFFNAYGPTETTVCATVSPCRPGAERVSIGRSIQNARVYVLDEGREPVPVGVPGELYVGGAVVARGYLNRDDLTRERFIADPFVPGAGNRLYRTGDVVRHLPGGDIEFLGRIGGQVKVLGHRIEPGEIESCLERHPAVLQSAVIVRADDGRQPRLVAFIVPRGELVADSDGLRAFAAAALPSYMVPASYIALAQLPVNTSGKIDRRALAGMDAPPPSEHVSPRDGLEATIARVFCEVLQVSTVSVRDNFFDLGGNSLIAIKLINELHPLTGRALPLTLLFQTGTVEEMAQWVRQQDLTKAPSRKPPRGGKARVVPLSRGGSDRPVVLIHPAGGSVFCYHELARAIGPTQPIYGIEPGSRSAGVTVEEIAATYNRELSASGIGDGIRLGGWSSGGLIAFEMARQLKDRGRSAGLLFLVDTWAAPPPGDPTDFELLCEVARLRASDLGSTQAIDPAGVAALPTAEQIRILGGELAKAGRLPRRAAEGQLRAALAQVRTSIRMARGYVAAPYDGATVFLYAAGAHRPEAYGWTGLCSRLDTYTVPGSHDTVLRSPHVAVVAGYLKNLFAPVAHGA